MKNNPPCKFSYLLVLYVSILFAQTSVSGCTKNTGDNLDWAIDVPLTINNSVVMAKSYTIKHLASNTSTISLSFFIENDFYLLYFLFSEGLIKDETIYDVLYNNINQPSNLKKDISVSLTILVGEDQAETWYELDTLQKENILSIGKYSKRKVDYNINLSFKKDLNFNGGQENPGPNFITINSLSKIVSPVKVQK